MASELERLAGLEAECKALSGRIDRQFADVERATALAADAIERRLSRMNELRDQINQERNTYLTNQTYDSKHQDLIDRIDRVEQGVDRRLGGEEATRARSAAIQPWHLFSATGVLSALVLVANHL